jgi:hypothetical protein
VDNPDAFPTGATTSATTTILLNMTHLTPQVAVSRLIGGEFDERWAMHPERPWGLVGPQDQLPSSAIRSFPRRFRPQGRLIAVIRTPRHGPPPPEAAAISPLPHQVAEHRGGAATDGCRNDQDNKSSVDSFV